MTEDEPDVDEYDHISNEEDAVDHEAEGDD